MRKLILASLALVAVLVLGYGLASTGSQAAGASVSVQMTAGRNQNSIGYTIVLSNPTSAAIGNVFVSGLVPDGTNYTDKSANLGGTLQGNQLNWAVPQVPAKGKITLTYKVTATQTAVGPNHAFAHWVTPSEGSAQTPEVYAEYQLISLDGVNTRDDHVRLPDGKVALTTTSGSGHQEDEMVTSGISNVGVGDFVFLEGAGVDSFENNIVSWSWSLEAKPAGSSASVENAGAQNASFNADRPGEYVVGLATANAKGQTAGSSISVTAGNYAGISLCASCHNGSVEGAANIMATFPQTGHADKFEGTWASYSGTSDYCIRCHTVNYNEAASNGNMASAAKAAGWDPKKASLLAWLKSNFTLDDVKADPNMGAKINIQCENCHGPGATAHTGTKSQSVEVCGQCHPQGAEWSNAAHAKKDPHMATNSSCAACHTGQGYVQQWVKGNKIVMPDDATPDRPANVPSIEQQSGIACATCHDPHEATHPIKSGDTTKSLQLRLNGEVTTVGGWKVNAGDAATCVRCHTDNRTPQNMADFIAGTRERGTHENTQGDVFYGKGIFDYNGAVKTTNSYHSTLPEACITCHMAPNPVVGPGADGQVGTRDDEKALSVGGHSWNMAADWNGTHVENTAACQTCHVALNTFDRPAFADYDGNGKVEGIQTEVKGLMAQLRALLPKDAEGEVLNSPVNNANSTEAQRKAMWNYNVIKIDGSYGVHNTAFTVQLLQQTYKQLTGKDVPGATLK